MVSKNAEEFWCEPECLKDPERLDLRRDVQNVGKSRVKNKRPSFGDDLLSKF
jgi:hypothetical protein